MVVFVVSLPHQIACVRVRPIIFVAFEAYTPHRGSDHPQRRFVIVSQREKTVEYNEKTRKKTIEKLFYH